MTLLEPHKCDICGEIFYVPEDPLRTLVIIDNGQTIIDYELCYDCKEAILKHIQKIQKR
jgi:hypothetical protein